MGLEAATYISDLVSTNPTANDYVREGDDHLRLIKATLLATFANITGAVTASHTELNYSVGVTSAIQTQIDALTASIAALELSDLTDVGVTTPTNLNALMADGDSWESRALTTADIQSGTFADARIAASNVTQHEAALTILESQITDAGLLARNAGNETITGSWTFQATVRIGQDTGGDSIAEFYDDTNDEWRSIMWDDSNEAFMFEDKNGNFKRIGSGSGADFLLMGA